MSDSLELSIHIEASPETVFRFLSDPALFQKWMGPGAILGTDTLTVHYPTGHHAAGTIRESIPNQRLVFGWGYSNNEHGIGPDSTVVTISLTPTPTGTLVTLTHAGLDAPQRAEHTLGWNHYLAQLAAASADLAFAASLPAAVQNYIAAWNETNESARLPLLEACWQDDAIFRDSMGATDTRSALNAYIANAHKFVPNFQLELANPPEQCRGYYRFSWLIRMPDGNIMARGTNFGQLAPNGRFASAIGFWDKQ